MPAPVFDPEMPRGGPMLPQAPQMSPAPPQGLGDSLKQMMPMAAAFAAAKGNPLATTAGMVGILKGRDRRRQEQMDQASAQQARQFEAAKFYADVAKVASSYDDENQLRSHLEQLAPIAEHYGISLSNFHVSDAVKVAKSQKEAQAIVEKAEKQYGDQFHDPEWQQTAQINGRSLADWFQQAKTPTVTAGGQSRPLLGGQAPPALEQVDPTKDLYNKTTGKLIKAGTPATPKPAEAGNFTDYLGRYARDIAKKPVEQLTAQEVEAARKRYQQADDSTEADAAVMHLSPAGLDAAARAYATNGTLPAMGMGKGSAAVRTNIINRAAQLYPDLDVAGNKQDYQANQASLSALQKQRDAITAFEETALKNLDVFVAAARKLKDTGSPILNKPLRSISEKGLGSADLAAFNAARRTVVPEFAKLLANPGLSGQLSDSARHEVDEVISGNATLAQILAVAQVLKTDAANRRTSMDDALAAIKGRRVAPGGAAGGSAPAKPKFEILSLGEVMPDYTVKDSTTGKTITFKWNGAQPPTDADFEEVFAAANQAPPKVFKAGDPVTWKPADPKDFTPSTDPEGSATGRLLSGAWKNLNPVNILSGVYNAVTSPLETGSAILARQGEQFSKAGTEFSQGRFSEATGHTLAGVLPLIGPAAADAGERIGAGDVAGGLGEGLGLVTPVLGAKPAVQAAKRVLPAATGAKVADALEAGASKRVVDVMAPKVGANKARFGNQAEKVAPELAKNPEMAAWSREGMHSNVGEGLARAEAALDAADAARNTKQVVHTKGVVDDLMKKRAAMTSQTHKIGAFKAGQDVVPGPNAARVAQIDQAISEIQSLGPVADFEALRQIRKAYDGPAKAVYSPAVTADYVKTQGGKMGAADVTGVLREHLAKMDPNTAAANAEYSLYKTAQDVLDATAEVERTRPKVGRAIIARSTGAIVGGEHAGMVGAIAGFVAGDLMNSALSMGFTTKLQTARLMSELAEAIRSGNTGRVSSLSSSLRRLATTSARQVPSTGGVFGQGVPATANNPQP